MVLTVTLNPTIDRVYFVDEFKIGRVHRSDNFMRAVGGKGLDVSRVVKILGVDTAAMGFVGGYTGDFVKTETKKDGVKILFTEIEGETRTCINISVKDGKSGEVLELGPFVTEEEVSRFLEQFKENIDDYNIIVVAGSMPRGMDSNFYEKLVDIAKEKGKRIIVDTSGDALANIITKEPFMVKPNNEELAALMGKEVQTDEQVKEALLYLEEKGVEVPFLSLGKEGAAGKIDGKFLKFTPPTVKVVNTVGSGDSVIAGISAGLDMGKDLIDSIKLGVAAGTANTQFEKPGFVTKELVDEILTKVTIKEI